MAFGMQQRLVGIGGFVHFIAVTSQDPHGHLSELVLILHNQDGLRSTLNRCVEFRRLMRHRNSFDSGQADRKARPEAQFAVYPNRSAILFDDSIHRRQAQASSLPRLFGREERFEKVRDHFRRHARTSVAHSQLHVPPRRHVGALLNKVFVEIDVLRFDQQCSAARHRVAGVHRQIH